MECPRCRNKELSSDGTCPACNYKVEQKKSIAESETVNIESESVDPSAAGKLTVDTVSRTDQDEIPPWRQELIQRLESLKRDIRPAESNDVQREEKASPSSDTAPIVDIKKKAGLSSGLVKNSQARRPTQKKRPSSDDSRSSAPQQKTIASLGEEVYTPPEPSESKDIRQLIDKAVSRQSTQPGTQPTIIKSESKTEPESKLILLSRTLSGLIDLIFVVLCTGAFIIAADSFSGIVVLDALSGVEYAILFLMIFFLYSIIFLSASGQTLGMMITDLRIIGIEGSRPSIGQLFSRCFGYLLSVILLGAGLLWSLFDRENRCFHDRFSNTSIIRLE